MFPDGALLEYFNPVMFGSSAETLVGIMKALADPDIPRLIRAVQGAARLPGAVCGHQRHIVAMCEVAEMLCDRLGMRRDVSDLFRFFTARWDGEGTPRGFGGEQLPVALRIVHVARDATFQCLLGGTDHVLRVMQDRSGKAFDPDVVMVLTEGIPARLLAVADACRTMIEPRPHRAARSPVEAARTLDEAASAGQIDPDAVAAVLEATGTAVPRMARPAGLTDREAQVISMVAKGLQTKQVGHRLGISAKTADRHLQNAYAKIGVSTRAAAALFAMQHGLTSWGELPIPDAGHRS